MLPDLQDQEDFRGVELDEVGISNVRYPVTFDDGSTRQGGIASFDVSVRLAATRRGTHMSRMVELVHDISSRLDPRELPLVVKTIAARLDVETARLSASLPIAFAVTSPASDRISFQPSDLVLAGAIEDGAIRVWTSLTTQVTSLCPCSKAISDYGAHNQRSNVSLTLEGGGDGPYPMQVADLFERIRTVGSCPIYPIVKRPDERAITMAAFDKPAFVEDMARDLSIPLRGFGITHEIFVRNLESIHSHDAVARVRWSQPSD